ncbi:hypothetical protein SCLCIDRAFT_783583 [Scleroderma citrinum Foug A]|uniref:Uncharacterized protein n=1 Tax=Scleroderma citrinum Foug A TaxID=1036808 RepID=A0A0C3DQK3_9AGAM|nr:hypothetical protein SCLCIDRAFT_783583 [Scleroderma citrinum Foug A]
MPSTELPTADEPIAAQRTRAPISSGTFPVSRGYQLRQMLSSPWSASEVHSGDVPIYADTVDLETVAFHQFWGCFLTPENIATQIHTDNIRYHAWVAAKKVVEQNCCKQGRYIQGCGDDPEREDALLDATMDQFPPHNSLLSGARRMVFGPRLDPSPPLVLLLYHARGGWCHP